MSDAIVEDAKVELILDLILILAHPEGITKPFSSEPVFARIFISEKKVDGTSTPSAEIMQ